MSHQSKFVVRILSSIRQPSVRPSRTIDQLIPEDHVAGCVGLNPYGSPKFRKFLVRSRFEHVQLLHLLLQSRELDASCITAHEQMDRPRIKISKLLFLSMVCIVSPCSAPMQQSLRSVRQERCQSSHRAGGSQSASSCPSRDNMAPVPAALTTDSYRVVDTLAKVAG